MESIEWTLLCPPLPSPSSTTTSSTSPASLILSGSYLSLLTDSELGHTFFSPDLSPPQQHSTTHSKLQSLLDTFLSSTSSTSTPLSDALCIGVAALLAFCQGSFTGPPLDTHQLSVLNCVDGEDGERVRGELSLDGEDVYALTPHPILLLLAIVVFEDERVSKLKVRLHTHLYDKKY